MTRRESSGSGAGPDDVLGSGAGEIARAMRALGVIRVFGVCGDHVNTLYRACFLNGIEIIGVRSESAAVQMADGLARATGFPGVAIVTGGPGHTNAVTGMAVAQSAASPVVVLSGLTPISQRERGGQQVLHQADIVRTVTKQAIEAPDAAHLAETVARAFRIACAPTPGPVSLSIPVDVLAAPASAQGRGYAVRPMSLAGCEWTALDHRGLDAAADSIARAERPCLVVGSGAWPAFAGAALQDAVLRSGLPAFTIDQARGLVPDDGKSGFGYADPIFNRAFREVRRSDVVVLLGAHLDFHTCFGGEQLLDPACAVVQIHADAARIGMCRASDISLEGPVRPLFEALASRLEQLRESDRHARWRAELELAFAAGKAEWARQLRELPPGSGIHPLQVCASLARHVHERSAIMIDGGDFVHWPRAYFSALRPGHWMDAVLMGNLGGALPLGIGAQLAFPDDPVWIFTGDGGFGFYSWELATAVERGLPIKVILGNDSAWGIEKRLQLDEYGEDVGCNLPYARYDRFAELVGARGFHVDSPDQLDGALDAMAAERGPCLLNVDIRRLCGRPLTDFPRY
ncbi:MAG: thiamine pyrophosphate-binding protein [Gemmatimonadaceae bacterium]|nr:thiamine pyrophosphate-binding protein [Gemmatimonadaceae bacterium]